jgi:probable FeS assembly SUF system protein SufT
MQALEQTVLARDCEAVRIPSGAKVVLKAGERVTIAQSLGDTFTVVTNGDRARIEAKDADALGKQAPATPPLPTTVSDEGGHNPRGHTSIDEAAIWQQLKTCYDPEIPVNIVDLGLVYDLQIVPKADGSSRVVVKMTLTAPGCGMGPVLAQDVETKVRGVPGISEVDVQLVWDPPWDQSKLSEAARLQLGLL